MVSIGSFRDMTNDYDEIWVIVRSLKSVPVISGTMVAWVPELSPSTELFYKVCDWKKAGVWGVEVFEREFVPQFLKEMHSKTAIRKLEELYEIGKSKCVLLVCYCGEEKVCHRSIVLGLLQGMAAERGEQVKLIGKDFPLDNYSDYYNQYCVEEGVGEDFYLLIAGSRDYSNYDELSRVTDSLLRGCRERRRSITIVSGGARGADTLAEQYAKERGYKSFVIPAEWDKYGRSAGYVRNKAMHECIATASGRACLCFWDRESVGTRYNFVLARSYGTQLRVWDFKNKRLMTDEEIAEVCD